MKVRFAKNFVVGFLLWILTIVLPFWVVIPFILMQVHNAFGWQIIDWTYLPFIGVILITLGLLLILVVMYRFAKFGHGTPAPYKPPILFLNDGIFSKTRNPMYIGYFLVFISLFLFTGVVLLLFYAILAIVGFGIYVVWVEEPKLVNRFGDEYVDYMSRVPRWV